jgi:hypothetical protein
MSAGLKCRTGEAGSLELRAPLINLIGVNNWYHSPAGQVKGWSWHQSLRSAPT